MCREENVPAALNHITCVLIAYCMRCPGKRTVVFVSDVFVSRLIIVLRKNTGAAFSGAIAERRWQM